MKKLIILIAVLTSFSAFSKMTEYSGNNNGAECTVKVDLANDFISMGGIGLNAREKIVKKDKIILKGGADFVDAKITLIINTKSEVTSAKLETRNMIIPFYLQKLNCINLLKVNE